MLFRGVVLAGNAHPPSLVIEPGSRPSLLEGAERTKQLAAAALRSLVCVCCTLTSNTPNAARGAVGGLRSARLGTARRALSGLPLSRSAALSRSQPRTEGGLVSAAGFGLKKEGGNR